MLRHIKWLYPHFTLWWAVKRSDLTTEQEGEDVITPKQQPHLPNRFTKNVFQPDKFMCLPHHNITCAKNNIVVLLGTPYPAVHSTI